MLVKLVKKFRDYGTVHNLYRKGVGPSHSGRKRTSRTQANIDAVRTSVGRSPQKSLRRRSQQLRVPRESLMRALISDLHLHPYKIQIKQTLTDQDKAKRVEMCEWFSDAIEENPDFLGDVWFADEAHFSCCQDMWIIRTMCIGEQTHQMKCCNDLCIPKSAQPGLPFQNTVLLDRTGLKTHMRGLRQSIKTINSINTVTKLIAT